MEIKLGGRRNGRTAEIALDLYKEIMKLKPNEFYKIIRTENNYIFILKNTEE